MTPYVITFIVMVGVFMIGCFAFKLPVGVSMLIAALCGALEGGLGTETIRMMVEGEFGYVDTILTPDQPASAFRPLSCTSRLYRR